MLRKLLAVSQSIQVLSKLQVSLSMAGLFIFFQTKKPPLLLGNNGD